MFFFGGGVSIELAFGWDGAGIERVVSDKRTSMGRDGSVPVTADEKNQVPLKFLFDVTWH